MQTIVELLDKRRRRRRFAAIAVAYADMDEDYAAEVDLWNRTLADGMDGGACGNVDP